LNRKTPIIIIKIIRRIENSRRDKPRKCLAKVAVPSIPRYSSPISKVLLTSFAATVTERIGASFTLAAPAPM
jgi:hypothetical protein